MELLSGDRPAPVAERRMLLISYNFPPGQATGALRWQQMSHVAAARGWAIDVITRHPDELSSADWSRLPQLPDAVRVFGVRTGEGSMQAWEDRAARILRRLKPRPTSAQLTPKSGSAVVQPPRAPELDWREELRWSLSPRGLKRAYHGWRFFAEEWQWARAAQQAASSVFDGHDVIASCGPPHMPHIAARKVARQTDTPLLIDLRDPWSLAPALPRAIASPLWYWLAGSYERSTISAAAIVVANTEVHARALRTLYPAAADRIIAVMNGCDEDPVGPEPTQRFVMCYAGNIYIDRDPRLIFRAAARLVEREQLTPEQFGIELLGHVDQFGGVSVTSLAEHEGVGQFLTVLPRLPRAEALRHMAKASVLVSLPQDVDLAIPSKVFEYTQFPSWLLALARPGSATEEVLRGSGADVVPPDDEEAIAQVLVNRYREFTARGRPEPINRDGRFSRATQAAILFDALERRVAPQAATRNRAA